ncbi:hypothetical protein KM043_008568 [Ampulex compressa]|nr:hypothetical protein KM043_008568 [Ampulex compressa]
MEIVLFGKGQERRAEEIGTVSRNNGGYTAIVVGLFSLVTPTPEIWRSGQGTTNDGKKEAARNELDEFSFYGRLACPKENGILDNRRNREDRLCGLGGVRLGHKRIPNGLSPRGEEEKKKKGRRHSSRVGIFLEGSRYSAYEPSSSDTGLHLSLW